MPQRPDSLETALVLIELLRRIPRRGQVTATVVQSQMLERWLRGFGDEVWGVRRRRLPLSEA